MVGKGDRDSTLQQRARRFAIKSTRKKKDSNWNNYIAIGIFGTIVGGVLAILIFNP